MGRQQLGNWRDVFEGVDARPDVWIHKHTRDFLRANVVLEGNRSESGTQVEKEQGFCLEGSSVRLARAQKSRIHAGEQQNCFRRLLNIQITIQTETETERDVHENTASALHTQVHTFRQWVCSESRIETLPTKKLHLQTLFPYNECKH